MWRKILVKNKVEATRLLKDEPRVLPAPGGTGGPCPASRRALLPAGTSSQSLPLVCTN